MQEYVIRDIDLDGVVVVDELINERYGSYATNRSHGSRDRIFSFQHPDKIDPLLIAGAGYKLETVGG